MRIYQSWCVALLAAITIAFTTASADDSVSPVTFHDDSSMADRIHQLESRLAMIESRGSGPNCAQRLPSFRVTTNTLAKPETYAGFELAILKVYPGSISTVPAVLGASSLTPGWDFEASPRFYFGRECCNGLGGRLTYWQFDQRSSNTAAFGITTGLEIHAIDLEATSRIDFCGSDVTFSGGIRYGYLESDVNVPDLGGQILNFQSEGVGPTLGLRARRQMGRTKWNLILAGRYSLILTDASMSIPSLVTLKADDSTMEVSEGRIGVERVFNVTDCASMVFQFAYEAQNWESGSVIGAINPTFALAGPTIRLGVNF